MSRTAIWSTVAVLALLALAVTWFLVSFDRIERIERTGYSAEARRDPYLAAKRMLERMGVAADELAPVDWQRVLGRSTGTLVVLSSTWTLGSDSRDRLFAWVRSGGNLVIASSPRTSDDEDGGLPTLMQWLDVQVVPAVDAEEREAFATSVTPLRLPGAGGAEALQAEFRSVVRLQPDHPGAFAALADDEHGACLLQRRHGRGRITLLCSARPLRNHSIGDAAHASLLWWLAGGYADAAPGPLWFVLDTDMPPLYAWLWQRIPEVLGTLGLALAVWLWAGMRRSGPLRDLQPPSRRRTLEHIEASARFAWQNGAGSDLLDAMRQAFHGELEQRHPAWARLPRAERLQRLARVAELSAEEVFRATEAPALERREFTEAVRNLQIIWRAL